MQNDNSKFKIISLSVILLGIFLLPKISLGVYDLPNDDADCPDNCRQIPWKAGSDIWNNGVLPTYPPVVCTGLTEGDGTTGNPYRKITTYRGVDGAFLARRDTWLENQEAV